jgi:crotonobetainyl-CoA:carnitine CoA-transferase CaiB-like acyl-CoA transferase
MARSLENIRVLDLSRFIAGPHCAMLLADMGADVIKVERPGGEDGRQIPPFVDGHSVYTMVFNRNKRAVTVNTRAERGRELLKKLVRWADVVVENYRPGTMEKMGLGYEQLKELNPRIILTSISGFGQTGPYRDRALFDAVAQAMSGLMYRNGEPDDPPTFTGIFLADYLSGIYAAYGTVLALFHRERTGEGQLVDVASLDAMFSGMGLPAMGYLALNEVWPRTGRRDPYAAPSSVFEARDGYVYLHGGTQPMFKRLAPTIGRPELLEDPRFATWRNRMEHIEEIEEIVGSWVRQYSVEEVGAKLEEAGIPFSPVLDIPEVVTNPQLAARDMIVETEHSEAGRISVPGVTVKLSETPGSVRTAPPAIGEHNQEVFADLLGLSASQIEELRGQGAI